MTDVIPTIGGIPLGDLLDIGSLVGDWPLDRPVYAAAPLPDGGMSPIVSASTVGEYATLSQRVAVAALEAARELVPTAYSRDVQVLIELLRPEAQP